MLGIFYGFRHSFDHCPLSSILLVGWLVSRFPLIDQERHTLGFRGGIPIQEQMARLLDLPRSVDRNWYRHSLASFIGIKKLANFNPDCLNVFVLSCHGRQSLPIVFLCLSLSLCCSFSLPPSRSSFAAWWCSNL